MFAIPATISGMIQPSANAIHGGVPKRSKGTVCKTVIRGFESRRRLFACYFLGD